MFNRLTDSTYSSRVWRSVNLLRGVFSQVKKDYSTMISDEISKQRSMRL